MKIGQTVRSLQVHKGIKKQWGCKKTDTDDDNFMHMQKCPP